ncbi:hypothetical protein BOSEA31B_11775 [Hyphomicrobiales bacterium]|nr:hypothetical protein BOSEA31B_11775 [Hyphomicrobiales bacterium]CAI0346323.1 hypothetical protein BO1005MUT1_40052 [Hyphomicrobiales bacterium]
MGIAQLGVDFPYLANTLKLMWILLAYFSCSLYVLMSACHKCSQRFDAER